MKVMKKIIKILIVLIIILLGILFYKKVILHDNIETNKEIKGDLITDNVHAVTLKENENSFINSSLVDNKEIYYIYMEKKIINHYTNITFILVKK